jgi:hypothetical protein
MEIPRSPHDWANQRAVRHARKNRLERRYTFEPAEQLPASLANIPENRRDRSTMAFDAKGMNGKEAGVFPIGLRERESRGYFAWLISAAI